MPENIYSVTKNRLMKSNLEGFQIDADGALVSDPESLFRRAVIFPFEGTEDGALWGRFSFEMELPEDTLLSVYCLALDTDDISSIDEMKALGAVRYMNCDDILLYDLRGRFLFIGFDVEGPGKVRLSSMKADSKGDIFMDSLPEIYNERGSFFHRFLSIFSSCYTDLQEEIDLLPTLLNPDTCPASLLPVYASWMGIEISPDLMDVPTERKLVHELFDLTRMKGTPEVIRRLCKIILNEDVRIIEYNIIAAKQRNSTEPGVEYGPYDVEVQIKKHLDETTHYQLMYLINQFKPVRVNVRLRELDESAKMDSSSYLDRNAVLPEDKSMILDEGVRFGGYIKLDE